MVCALALADRWAADFGTEPPEFGQGFVRPSEWAALARMAWADSVFWLRAILGFSPLPGQIAKLQALHFGADSFRARRAAKRARYDFRAGENAHNEALAEEARRKRFRVARYCLKACDSAGAFVDSFRAACVRVYGSPAPFANRSKTKGLRDWAFKIWEKARGAENVTDPCMSHEATASVRGFGTKETPKSSEDLTHLPGAAGAPTEEVSAGAVCLRGCRRDQEPASGLQNQYEAKEVRRRLTGCARSALPTLADLHETHDLVPWEATGDRHQVGWALGWLTHHLTRGCALPDLVRVYGEHLARFVEKARARGYGPRECAPWILRAELQTRAAGLPTYALESFKAAPRFAPTRAQIAAKAAREAKAASRAEKPAKRIRRRKGWAFGYAYVPPRAAIVASPPPVSAEVEKYRAAYRAAASAGDFEKCARLLSLSAASGVKL